ncbi:MAG: polymer-forming cytoskeletal protein [Candidatus Methylomirabilales bacterium]
MSSLQVFFALAGFAIAALFLSLVLREGRKRQATLGQAGAPPPPTARPEAILAPGITLKGEVGGKGQLRILSRVEGTIAIAGFVHVGEGGEVWGKIQAPEITVAGHVVGELLSPGRITFLPTGRLQGSLRTRSLVVAEGAQLNGTVVAGRPDALPAPGEILEELVQRDEARAYLLEERRRGAKTPPEAP